MNGPIVTTFTTPEGALIIPQDVRKIGLWDKGAPIMGTDQQPQPGGTTLLAGHVDDVAQGNGTLHDLYKVEPGALVYVADPAGAVTRWRVVGWDVVVKAAPGLWRGETEQVSTGSPYSSCWRSSPVPSCGWPSPSARMPPSDAAAQALSSSLIQKVRSQSSRDDASSEGRSQREPERGD